MLKLENTVTPSPEQWEAVIRGMRNPMNSWDKSDSEYKVKCLAFEEVEYCDPRCHYDQCSHTDPEFVIGKNDHGLMMKLSQAGSDHAKFRRMIPVYVDIVAPLYWWKEFDTYKVGTVANSCSTMHKIHAREFTLDDFSHEELMNGALDVLNTTIEQLNFCRRWYLSGKNKDWWWQMIQLLPTSYNQRRTVMLNYEVLANIYKARRNHKLTEWHTFCEWIEKLPYSEIIIGEKKDV